MKLKMECAVEASVLMRGDVEFTVDRMEYTFVASEDRRLRSVALVCPVDHPERFSSSVTPAKGDVSFGLVMETDEELVAAMRHRLQALESHMAFRLPLARIHWDSPRLSLLFVSDEERARHEVLGFRLNRVGAQREFVEVTATQLGKAVQACDRFAGLTTLLAFMREGANEYFTFRYINAFYNFYFVLEGLFGGGKWRNEAVKAQFASSPTFQRATHIAITALQTSRPRDYVHILAATKPEGSDPTPGEVAEVLVNQRGALHHFVNRSDAAGPSPFEHDHFKPVCELARAVALQAVLQEMVEIARREKHG